MSPTFAGAEVRVSAMSVGFEINARMEFPKEPSIALLSSLTDRVIGIGVNPLAVGAPILESGLVWAVLEAIFVSATFWVTEGLRNELVAVIIGHSSPLHLLVFWIKCPN